MSDRDLNQGNLDFEKMNATLANPEFANWYYNELVNRQTSDLSMNEFVNIINDYNENNLS